MKLRSLLIGLTAVFLMSACGGDTPSNQPPFSYGSSSDVSSEKSEDATSEVDNDYDDVTSEVHDEEYISFHYYRADGLYDNWALWLWEPNGFAKEEDYLFQGKDKFGAYANYPLSGWTKNLKTNGLGFIIKSKGSWSSKDVGDDRFIDFSALELQNDNAYHVYLFSEDPKVYVTPDKTEIDKIMKAEFTNVSTIKVQTATSIGSYKILRNNDKIFEKTFGDEQEVKNIVYNLPAGEKLQLGDKYDVEITFKNSKKVVTKEISTSVIFKDAEFIEKYTYNGNDLGATFTENKTMFKVWSPISSEISVRIYNSGTPVSYDKEKGDDTIVKEIPMVKGSDGVFSAIDDADYRGKYYTYVVTNSTYVKKEIVDPYAKSAGVNGLRGMIVDFAQTNPEGWDAISAHPYDRKELTIWETHIADITSSKTWGGSKENAKKFLGACETGTKFVKGDAKVSTGFDHIKELGVNAVQFVPIFDQANDEVNVKFNWGYNPLNYNVLEGAYSSNPYDGYARIREFKQLVKAYNEAGINIIMDVVYNHVAGAIASNFDVLMPGYYFRYNSNGNLSNGSGCGNETASDMPMMRKFMIDSTQFWAEEYKLGGFRFDLMALHDIETMNQLTANLKTKVNENICVFGEPWNGGDSPLSSALAAKQDNAKKFVGFGQFNDQTRDALIKGGFSGVLERGWISEDRTAPFADGSNVISGLKGKTPRKTDDPDKTVNYVTCHDNYTLYDRLMKAELGVDKDTIKKIATLANSIVFTSQGTSFMLAGEEFLRTKGGDNNSYMSSYEVNELNYELKMENADMFNNYKKLIAFKQNFGFMHLNMEKVSAGEILKIEHLDKTTVIKITLKDTDGTVYTVLHRNGYNKDKNYEFDLTGSELYMSTIDSNKQITNKTQLLPFETLIVSK